MSQVAYMIEGSGYITVKHRNFMVPHNNIRSVYCRKYLYFIASDAHVQHEKQNSHLLLIQCTTVHIEICRLPVMAVHHVQ